MFRLRLPIDAGVFCEAPGGFAFVGVRGTRMALRREDVAGAAVERLRIFPPWHGVRFERRDGTRRWIAVTETAHRRAVRARAEEIVAAFGGPRERSG